jgi:hypothetical protein
MLLGSEESLRYWRMAVSDYEKGKPDHGLKLLWIHTIPFARCR